jgi:hypothetical protein
MPVTDHNLTLGKGQLPWFCLSLLGKIVPDAL